MFRTVLFGAHCVAGALLASATFAADAPAFDINELVNQTNLIVADQCSGHADLASTTSWC